MFDDFKNLNSIGSYGRVHDLKTLLYYLTSGDADPVGRPLSLLSFLIDADDWPADPSSFKHTNVLLHLLNGMLLAWVLLRLGRHLRPAQGNAAAAAALAALLWTLHPLWVSTALYVVQRQAMLAATFSLAGMLCWTIGRERLAAQLPRAWLWLLAGAWGCTALAVLSKANGIVLPLLLWVTDSLLLGGAPGERQLQRMRLLCLKLPSLLVGLWLALTLYQGLRHPPTALSWTIGQRLLTEPRALSSYLDLLWIPRGSLGGLLNDDYPASTGLLHPWTTLPSIAVVAGLIGAALRLRRSHPALSFAVLFFFAGHLIESSVIPLELYFEHRNYLPAAPMFWPLAIWLTDARQLLPRLRIGLAAALPCVLALLAHARATTWGNPYELAMSFVQASPNSARAQMTAAYYELAYGRPLLAARQFRYTVEHFPAEPLAGLHLIEAECALGSLSPDTRRSVLTQLDQAQTEAGVIHYWMVAQIPLASSGRCKEFDLAYMNQMLAAVRANRQFSADPTHLRDVEHLQGRLTLAGNDPAAALDDFNRSLARLPAIEQALEQASLLGAAGYPELGLRHLEYFATLAPPPPAHFSGMPSIHTWLLRRGGYWTERRLELEAALRAAAQKAPAVSPLPGAGQ